MTRLLLSPDLFPVHLAVVFLFGAVMGSFFNVCIYRLPLGQSVNRPRRSFCPACGTMIVWYDNIPIVSYLALGGLCRHCGARISGRYLLIELLTALLFSAVFWVHGYALATPMFLFLAGVLIISTFTDLDHWIIPDSISLGGTAVGVAAALVVSAIAATGRWPNLGRSLYLATPFQRLGPWGFVANSLAGAAFGYFLLWTIGIVGTLMFRKDAMGMGDMKLFACLGAFFGWQGCILVLVLASFLGATIGLSLIAAQWIVAKVYPAGSSVAAERAASAVLDVTEPAAPESAPAMEAAESQTAPRSRERRLHHLPFGPYIAIAGYVVALFYRPMMDWLMQQFFIFDVLVGR